MRKHWLILQAASIAEARAQASAGKPIAAVVDLRLPDGDATAFVAELNEQRIKVVVFSGTDDSATVARSSIAGAAGFLGKARHELEVVAALQRVLQGDSERFFPDEYGAVESSMPQALRSLSPAERRIFILLGDALPSKEIAERLHRSVRTIDEHRAALVRKLGVHPKELTRYAVSIRTGAAFHPRTSG